MKLNVACSNSIAVHYSTVLMPSGVANNIIQNARIIQINTQFNSIFCFAIKLF